MDEFDLKLLRLVQHNNRLTAEELGLEDTIAILDRAPAIVAMRASLYMAIGNV